MLLAEVAATSDAVAATRSRLAKRTAIADLLRRVADDAEAGSAEVEIAVAYLAGELRQRRTGLGWRWPRDLAATAAAPRRAGAAAARPPPPLRAPCADCFLRRIS